MQYIGLIFCLQIKWCTQVFTDPAPIVVDLLTEVLNDLDPSLSSLISHNIEDDDRPVAALIKLKQVGSLLHDI